MLVVGATPGELGALEAALGRPRRGRLGPFPWVRGTLGAAGVQLLCSGIGKVNAALAAGAALARTRPALLLSVGVGGAYPSAGLATGELAVATEECFGDEGVETGRGWQGLEAVGIAVWEDPQGRAHFNRFPADGPSAARLLAAGRSVAPARAGAFVTVSTVTGTARRARFLEERFGGVCESMEGAALAQAAARHGVPFAEVRGISNAVGPRDRASWRLREAADASQAAALAFLRELPEEGGAA